jgi:hypothetical protein
MSKNKKKNVSAGKPKIGGSIFCADVGATLPTDATSDLSDDYKALGYISEDGVANGLSGDGDTIKAWGGDIVLKTSSSETYVFTMIESLNEEVLKTVYGDDNVVGDEDGALDISHKPGEELPSKVIVIEILMTGRRAKRIVIPDAEVTAVGEVTYKDSAAIGYPTTLTAHPDDYGATAHEYISAPIASGNGGGGNQG